MPEQTLLEELGEAIASLESNVSQQMGKGSAFDADIAKLKDVYSRLAGEQNKTETDVTSVSS